MNNGVSIAATSQGFTDGNLFSLDGYGYFRTTEPIRGITRIDVCYGDGSAWAKIVPCYYDYEHDEVVTTTADWGDAAESADFSDAPIDYFELYNPDEENDIVITGISITYSCSTATHSFSLSFTPDWDDKEAASPADIYIAGTRELLPEGTETSGWSYQKLTCSNGVYSIHVDGLTNGIYVYALYAEEAGAAYFNWNNKNAAGDQSLLLSGDVIDTTAYAWDSEPGYVSPTSYTLTIHLYTGSSNINYLELDYLIDADATKSLYNSDCTQSKSIASPSSGVNTFTLSGIAEGQTVYFAFKDWNTAVNKNVVLSADSSWHAIRYTPRSLHDNEITITRLDYDAADKTAEYPNLAYSGVYVEEPAYGYVATANGGSVALAHNDYILNVYDQATISPASGILAAWTASYSGQNIRIDENLTITGLKAGTSTTITLTATNNPSNSCTFNVSIPASAYEATKGRDATYASSEGWFNSTTVDPVDGLGSDFYNGVDVSSMKELIDHGRKFYNADGDEQHLLYILKDAGINWVRIRLWVQPQNDDGSILYGGGQSDLDHALWLAKEAKGAGLKILLDFHYSDFWADPTHQIIPKAWASCASKAELCARIQQYTTAALTAFEEVSCLPDMVQLGNEISSGIYTQLYTGEESINQYGEPAYFANKTSSSLGTTNKAQYYDYLKAASDGVKAVSSSIKRVLHWAKGGQGAGSSAINAFFNAMSDDVYDVAAISYYPYYCFDSLSDAQTALSGISIHKPWFIVETSYPFSGASHVDGVTSFSVSNGTSGLTSITDSYSFTPAGQAHMIHDLTAAVVNAGGKGIFYWEPAWVPNEGVGWAGSGSLNSWGNQGFFSYDGKAMANLGLFAKMHASN